MVPYKTTHILPNNPAITPLGIYSKELKTVHTKTCTWMFIEDLFVIIKTWKQPRCPSVGDWINKLWYNYKLQCYSAPRINELSSNKYT